jgi:NAD+ kinase
MSVQPSEMPSESPSAAVSRVAVVTHGRAERIGDALARLHAVAERCGVDVVSDAQAELAVVLGGDGTTLRALHRFLGTGIPCLGVNFGRVGFLTSIESSDLEAGLERAFRGEYDVVELPVLQAEGAGLVRKGVNDVVLSSGILGRMVIVEWSVDGVPMGELGCDGAILATSTGSTGYNLSAGGPVVAWGTDAFVVSFVSPHSLHARSMVLGRGHRVEVANRSDDVPFQVIVDGHGQGEVPPGGRVVVGLTEGCAHLARLRNISFFSRYRQTFST